MSRKNNLRQFRTITDGDMSASTITSAVTNIQFLDNIAIQLNIVTANAIGNFTVEVSVDYSQDDNGNVTNAGHWVPVTLSPSPAATGTDSQIYIDLNQLASPWIRVKYTKTSGTGVLNAYISAKML